MSKKIVEATYKTYLVGAIEKTGGDEGGADWRDNIGPRLSKLGIFVFDPLKLESSKVNLSPEEFLEKLVGYKRSGNWHKFMEEMNKIWIGSDYMDDGQMWHMMGDKDYVTQSDFLIGYMKDGDSLGGTIIEIGWAHFMNKPVYFVTEQNKTDMNSSLIWAILSSGGEIFRSFTPMLEFIKGRYDLEESDDQTKT